MDLRYRAQQSSITVEASGTEELEESAIRAAFESEHDRLFGHIQPGGDVEITALRLQAAGTLQPRERPTAKTASGTPSATSFRRVWIDRQAGWQECAVFAGSDLRAGHTVLGPAVVEEDTTTVLVGVGDSLAVDAWGNYSIEVRSDG